MPAWRNPYRRGRCCIRTLWYWREISWDHTVCPRAKHNRIHECDIIRIKWQHSFEASSPIVIHRNDWLQIKYGNWLSICIAGLPPANSRHGHLFCLVCSGQNGCSVRYIYVRSAVQWLVVSLTWFYSLIFPRWDALTIILSVFLMTYTYIEAKSNYHRGSILILR